MPWAGEILVNGLAGRIDNNGRNYTNFDLHIEKKEVFFASEYDVKLISILSKSGDIITS